MEQQAMEQQQLNLQGQDGAGQDPNFSPPQPQAPPPQAEGVVLSPEQYNAVLDHIAELEARVMAQGPGGKQDVQTLDQLVNEAQTQPQAPPRAGQQQVPIEDMTPQQVIGLLYQNIQQQLIQPLETKVETLRIMSEIDKVANKQGNEDFWDYAGLVKEIAIRNPTLSIQQAYNLAKTEGKRGPTGPGETGLKKKSDSLFTLPPRPNIPAGEKPGASGSQMRPTAPLSRRDAASEAFDRATSGKK